MAGYITQCLRKCRAIKYANCGPTRELDAGLGVIFPTILALASQPPTQYIKDEMQF